ncbi:unnamed protein product [Ophioblennius macclurei]
MGNYSSVLLPETEEFVSVVEQTALQSELQSLGSIM